MTNPTTASAAAKAAGLAGIPQMSQISNVKQRTLYNMFHDNRRHFDALAAGCVQILREVYNGEASAL